MEKEPVRSERKISYSLNLLTSVEGNDNSLGLNVETITNTADLMNKNFICEKIQDHISKYPLLFSQEGVISGNLFLSDLLSFVESALLLRVNDGVGDISQNPAYYDHLKEISNDYKLLLRILNAERLSDKNSKIVLDKFYKAGYPDLFLSCLMHCTLQKNACLVIINEIHFFSNKLCYGLSNKSENLSDVAIEWTKMRIDSFNDFSKAHSKFLSLCLEERKSFVILLNEISEYCMKGRKTSELYLQESHFLLSNGAEMAQKIIILREVDKALAKEKYRTEKSISEGALENSVSRKYSGGSPGRSPGRSPKSSSDSSSDSVLRSSSSGNVGHRRSHKLIRKLSFRSENQKIDKAGGGDSFEKDEKKRDTK